MVSCCANYFSRYPVEIEGDLQLLCSQDKTQRFIQKITDTIGKIGVEYAIGLDKGSWVPDLKVIHLNPQLCIGGIRSREQHSNVVATLLFELCNATHQEQLKSIYEHAVQGHLDKERYVRSIEEVEYASAKEASALIGDLVNRGSVVKNCHFHQCFDDFSLFYLWEQLNGHSTAVAAQYDALFKDHPSLSYQGTWPAPIPEQCKKYFKNILVCMNALTSKNQEDKDLKSISLGMSGDLKQIRLRIAAHPTEVKNMCTNLAFLSASYAGSLPLSMDTNPRK